MAEALPPDDAPEAPEANGEFEVHEAPVGEGAIGARGGGGALGANGVREGPERIGRYEVMGELAAGGMAVVYLARLPGVGGFQRVFALKCLHPHLARETEFVDMFLDEARLAASVRSAHVVPILEVGIAEAGEHFVVMEYVEGASLASLVASACELEGRVPTSVALRVALDALAGLHAAHEARDEAGAPLGIVHRDVSPQNILVGVDGVARLTDFGIARAESRLSTTRDGTFKGKLSYMAPEQASGGEVDRRADVFAAAVIAWELLANRRLFKGTNDLHTVHLLLYDRIPRLGDFHPGVPPALDEALARALDRDPQARFASAAELAEALERAAAGWATPAAARDLAAFVEATAARSLARQREILRARSATGTAQRTALVTAQVLAAPAGPSAASVAATQRVARRPAPEVALSTAEVEAFVPPSRLLPRLVVLGLGAGLAALAVFGYQALSAGPPGAAGGPPERPSSSARFVTPDELSTVTPAAPPSPEAPPAASADALPGASASAEAGRPAKPPRPSAPPPERPQDEYPGLNPYR